MKELKIKKDVSLFQLLKYSDSIDKLLMIIGTFCALLQACLRIIGILFYGHAVDVFIDREKYLIMQSMNSTKSLSICYRYFTGDTDFENRIFQTSMGFLLLACVSFILNYIAHVTWNTAAERQAKSIRNLLFKRILQQDISFFDRSKPAYLTDLLAVNTDHVKAAIGFRFQDTINLFVKSLALLIFALVIAWQLSLVFVLMLPLASVSTALIVAMYKKYTKLEQEAYGEASNVAQQVFSAMRTVISLGIQDKKLAEYTESLKRTENVAIKKGLRTAIFHGLSSFFLIFMFAIPISYGVYLVRTDCFNYSPSIVLQSFFAVLSTSMVLGDALPFISTAAQAKVSAVDLFDLLEQDECESNSGGKALETFKGAIRFESVCFSYPQRPDLKILNEMSFTIPAGKTVALCGVSGGGKSTVFQLLHRLYKPSSGAIKLDEKDIEDLDVKWLRSQIGIVSQEPVLFSMSIKENIRIGRLEASDEEVIKAAVQANAHDFIMNLDEKYETQVGERGLNLSGGQKQRIAIARALIRQPAILLFDEATSALDSTSERVVQNALDRAKVGRTTIVIAHRLSTIRNADLIICLSDGQVAESGTHDELMRLKKLYYNLCTVQVVGGDNRKSLAEKSVQTIVEKSQTKAVATMHRTAVVAEKSCTNYEIVKNTWKLSFPEIAYVIVGGFCQILAGLQFPSVALTFCSIYGIFANPNIHEQERSSYILTLVISVFTFIGSVGVLFHYYLFSIADAKLVKRVREKMFGNMLRQEIGWHDLQSNHSSILVAQLSVNATLIKGLTTDVLAVLLKGLGGVMFSSVISLILNWKLALTVIAFAPVNLFCGIVSIRASKGPGKLRLEEESKLTAECIENIKTVVCFGREEYFVKKFGKISEHRFGRTLGLLHVQALCYGVIYSIVFLIQAFAFYYGFKLRETDNLSISNLFRIFMTITFSTQLLSKCFSDIPDQRKASEAARTALEVMHRKSKIDSMSEDGLKPDRVNGVVEYHEVEFKYPTRDSAIFKGLNLTIKSNQTTALVGQSGSGKSTVTQLLMRFYDVDKGKITLDGVDIRDLNIKWLRSQIGLVMQDAVLFDCTIFENISYGDVSRSALTMDEVVDVATQANIHQRVTNLPDKYNTLVGNKGGQLSGGEKQRVAIARALIKRPKILLLDEATSALDTTSESLVQDALEKAQRGRTCVCIAHRLSTVQNAAQINVLKDGYVVEEGSHEELMSNKSEYYSLQSQSTSDS